MAWTEKEISDFQVQNKKVLDEINSTLKPKNVGGEKIGIFCPGQNGDCITASSVLRYRDILWPGKEIIWFCNMPVADFLKYSDINEVRPWPWRGNGLPLDSEDYWPMLTTENNRLNQTLKLNFPDTADISEGYFPAPYMLPANRRHGLDYPNCSRHVFGLDMTYEWHPVLNYSEEEREEANKFIKDISGGDRKIIIETFAGSGQSLLSEEMIIEAMDLCRAKWGRCVFIFASHKFLRNQEQYPDSILAKGDTTACTRFTVRQCALLAEKCDLMISVSSGITVAASAWGIKQPPTLQFCGSWVCSTQSLANGRHFELVTADNKLPQIAQAEFAIRLENLLNLYK